LKLTGPLTARYADYAPEFPKRKRTAAQQAGLNYEKALMKRLKFLYPKLEIGPWLYFHCPTRSGICQPDGMLWLTDNRLLIIECKLTHKPAARKKLMDFYFPVVAAIHPKATISCVQVFKNISRGSHKKLLTIYELAKSKPNTYKESQWIGI
jgi:hypothetical protein